MRVAAAVGNQTSPARGIASAGCMLQAGANCGWCRPHSTSGGTTISSSRALASSRLAVQCQSGRPSLWWIQSDGAIGARDTRPASTSDRRSMSVFISPLRCSRRPHRLQAPEQCQPGQTRPGIPVGSRHEEDGRPVAQAVDGQTVDDSDEHRSRAHATPPLDPDEQRRCCAASPTPSVPEPSGPLTGLVRRGPADAAGGRCARRQPGRWRPRC